MYIVVTVTADTHVLFPGQVSCLLMDKHNSDTVH